MHIEKYRLQAEKDLTRFEFISEGPKGSILKRIQFQPINALDFYNLAFGDVDSETDNINDLAVSDNCDTEKILATVISAMYLFSDHYPKAFVYATGSTKARTRLYRMGINRYYKEMQEAFYLFGQVGKEFVPYEKGTDYDGFLAQRKFY